MSRAKTSTIRESFGGQLPLEPVGKVKRILLLQSVFDVVATLYKDRVKYGHKMTRVLLMMTRVLLKQTDNLQTKVNNDYILISN